MGALFGNCLSNSVEQLSETKKALNFSFLVFLATFQCTKPHVANTEDMDSEHVSVFNLEED